jgi:hypothetical protein
MTPAACSIIPRMSPAISWGRRSAIHTSRRASSSRSTISSRATMPLPKVTTRAPSSRRVSTTKPGTRRVCNAPTSRTAAHTFSGLDWSKISLRIEAIGMSPVYRSAPGASAVLPAGGAGWPHRAGHRRQRLGKNCGQATQAPLALDAHALTCRPGIRRQPSHRRQRAAVEATEAGSGGSETSLSG